MSLPADIHIQVWLLPAGVALLAAIIAVVLYRLKLASASTGT